MKIILSGRHVLIGLLATVVLFGLSFKAGWWQRQPVVSVAAEKMNVFYIDVNNPVTIAVSGVPSESVKVRSEDVKIISQGIGKYIVLAYEPGLAEITVTAPGMEPVVKTFRVKKLPDPSAAIAGPGGLLRSGKMAVDTFKTLYGVSLDLPADFDFDCRILSYELIRAPEEGVPEMMVWQADDTSRIGKLFNFVQLAQPGDVYYFTNVLVRCANDATGKRINPLIVQLQ